VAKLIVFRMVLRAETKEDKEEDIYKYKYK
jgi:hypothetical protein